MGQNRGRHYIDELHSCPASLVPRPSRKVEEGLVPCRFKFGEVLHHITSPNECHSYSIHVATTRILQLWYPFGDIITSIKIPAGSMI